MHERLSEMGRSLSVAQSPTLKPRDTYTKQTAAERRGTCTTEAVGEEELSFQSCVSVAGGRDTPDTTTQGVCTRMYNVCMFSDISACVWRLTC